jgi:16S rRNA (guanine527-N7)-methyltransferase
MTPVEAERLRHYAREFDIDIEPDLLGRLDRFIALLLVWNRRIRLTGERDRATLVAKHTLDSLAPAPYLPESGLVTDIGSGAGFPGIVLGCVRPDLPLILVESRRRRASFLREAIRAVPLPRARVLEVRAEEALRDPDLSAGSRLVVSRALRLDRFLALAAPLLDVEGVALAMQTPTVRDDAPAIALEEGYRLRDVRDYQLPGGARRSLLLFSRSVAPSRPVS